MSLAKFMAKAGNLGNKAATMGKRGAVEAAILALENPKKAAALGVGGAGAAGYGAGSLLSDDDELEDIDDLEEAGGYAKNKISKLIDALGLG